MRRASSYPLLEGERDDLPMEEGGPCPVCGQEFGSITVTLLGGAAAWDGSDGYGPADTMRGLLNFRWNQDLPDDPDSKFLVAYLPVVEDVTGGQFSMNTCSIACMRRLLQEWMDELEKRAEKETASLAALKARKSR